MNSLLKYSKFLLPILILSLLILPAVGLAQSGSYGDDIETVTNPSANCGANFSNFINCGLDKVAQPLVYLFIALAIVYLLAGMLKYIRKGDDEKERQAGRDMMVYGIIALFVMISVWGFVGILIRTVDFETTPPPVPTFNRGS